MSATDIYLEAVLVRCDPQNLILEGFYQSLAIHQGWPSLDQIVAK